mmetsp:Transcript_34370/g.83120  ORF Transcript_34370/g.83120 Transcript_34370/m.83120 type:complete len:252 (+) Transcript_34370:657-1412(+)
MVAVDSERFNRRTLTSAHASCLEDSSLLRSFLNMLISSFSFASRINVSPGSGDDKELREAFNEDPVKDARSCLLDSRRANCEETPFGHRRDVSITPLPFTSIGSRLIMEAPNGPSQPSSDRPLRQEATSLARASRARDDMFMQPGTPVDSIRAAMFTVSPKNVYFGTFLPTTPLYPGPVCTPTRSCSCIPFGGLMDLAFSNMSMANSATLNVAPEGPAYPSCPAATMYASPIVSALKTPCFSVNASNSEKS